MGPDLKSAVEAWLEQRGGGSRRAGTAALSDHYARGGRSDSAIDLDAYLAARLPATHAATLRVLSEIAERRPDFAPASLVDVGSGPGTASWAAADIWPGLGHISLLDNNPQFLDLAARLAKSSTHLALANATARRGDLMTGVPAASLVIAAYALAEIPESGIAAASAVLWTAAQDMLVLIEPGTPAGFARIRVARTWLLGQGAVPVAPCPHATACPVTGSDWCHFSVRLPRSRAHMHAKGASVPFEDEKFSYLAVSRSGAPSGGARVLSPPLDQKPGLTFRICTEAGIEHRQIARRDRDAYKAHRKAGWGDLV